MRSEVSVFWFRRDLRLEDNKGLYKALKSGNKIVPIFIFDDEILDQLPKDDARVSFIYDTLEKLYRKLKGIGVPLFVKRGNVLDVWQKLILDFNVTAVYTNKDYEPYATKRDTEIKAFLKANHIQFYSYKDQVVFEKNEVLKNNDLPYTVFTPYKNKWLKALNKEEDLNEFTIDFSNFYKSSVSFPSLEELGFERSRIKVKPYNLLDLDNYDEIRDFPALDKTSYLSPYLRFGLVSIRKTVRFALKTNITFLSELIWREFFMQILYHFPRVVTQNFKQKYDAVSWRNDKEDFKNWCEGKTGYPMIDAGMRELNTTGYMHNRVRMLVAGFLCKHLLIDWRWGEAYFAKKLLDFELASNNGNWQWAAGTGCDAAPYFRIFNPMTQIQKFDKNFEYISKWVPEFQELTYPKPIVDHKFARERCLKVYSNALS
ncbi:cryptochrome/photolyase family protein [Aquimarina sediminis]|uniref:cryptochrome/photolyase family protein n=1 Tax=Aquimarina sediminis TaxID=2070536 RepID=UPI000CA04780|nr:deoxyribodipyrimidine photo-lyase [Aquimarina sediminis]